MFRKIIKLLFLYPLSRIWVGIHRLRRFCYTGLLCHSYLAPIPVISIGNLSFGGTGKTPLMHKIASWLQEWKLNIVISTRGYKSKLEQEGALLSMHNYADFKAEEVGDEPLWLAQRIQQGLLAIGKQRTKLITKALAQFPLDVISMEDGFQHLKMQRDVNIVLVDATLPLHKYFAFPLGRLREEWQTLKAATVVLLTKTNLTSNENKILLLQKIKENTLPATLILESQYLFQGFFSVIGQERVIKEQKILVVTAIADPDSFVRMLRQLSLTVVETLLFPDHHAFTTEEVLSFMQKAKDQSLLIVMTEKDQVKVEKIQAVRDNQDIVFARMIFHLEQELLLKNYLKQKVCVEI